MTIKELQSVTSGNGEESGGSDEEADKEPVVSRFVEEVSSLKYFWSYTVDDASVSAHEDHEIELLFIQLWKETAPLLSLHLTNRADIIPWLF